VGGRCQAYIDGYYYNQVHERRCPAGVQGAFSRPAMARTCGKRNFASFFAALTRTGAGNPARCHSRPAARDQGGGAPGCNARQTLQSCSKSVEALERGSDGEGIGRSHDAFMRLEGKSSSHALAYASAGASLFRRPHQLMRNGTALAVADSEDQGLGAEAKSQKSVSAARQGKRQA